MKVQTQIVSKFLLLEWLLLIDFVAEYHEGYPLELLHLEQRVELLLCLGDPVSIRGVDDEYDAVQLATVLLPCLAGLEMTAQVVRIESYVSNGDLCLVGVDGWIGLGEAITLQHIEKGGLSCVIEAKEDDVGTLLEET